MRWAGFGPALGVAVLLFCGLALRAETAPLPLADGFDLPVGHGTGKGYYKARGFQPNGHLGEDWNGVGGGDTDLGDPVYAAAVGLVLFARDYHVGWGNVIILRHAYVEEGVIKYADSLYGHLDKILVSEGDTVQRAQQIGTIGNNHGMYEAHLHFEMRKNLAIGMNRSAFARDFSNYFDPTTFVEQHRQLERGGEMASVPINTFNTTAPALDPTSVETPFGKATTAATKLLTPNPGSARGPFLSNKYGELRPGTTPAPRP